MEDCTCKIGIRGLEWYGYIFCATCDGTLFTPVLSLLTSKMQPPTRTLFGDNTVTYPDGPNDFIHVTSTWANPTRPTLTPEQKPPFLSGDDVTQAGELPLFEIWMSGYAASGDHDIARQLGSARGNNFNEACTNFRYPCDYLSEYDGSVMIEKGAPLELDSPARYRPSIWACGLYDNEADARRSFG